MKAVEFEATVRNHTLRVPEDVPDGKRMRVVLLFDESEENSAGQADVKAQLMTLTEGLSDQDLHRQKDAGREVSDWLT